MLKRLRPAWNVLLVFVLSAMLLEGVPLTPHSQAASASESPVITANDYINGQIPSYLEWMATKSQSYRDAPALKERLSVKASEYAGASDQSHFQMTDNGLLWKDGDSWLEYKLMIPEDGLYNFGFVYDTSGDGSTDIVRGIQIDGTTPFIESENIHLKHAFADSVYPPQKDEFGNDIVPQSVDVKGLRDVRLSDFTADTQPLKWYLTKGVHTIRITNQQGEMVLNSIYADAPVTVPTYSEVSKSYPAASSDDSFIQIVEAEHSKAKSNTSIQLQSTNDALVSPDPRGLIRYNTIGGEQFKTAGEWVEWEIDVPKDGQYEIGFKYKQSFLNNSNAYESITIDGKTPFQELENIPFPYDSSWGWDGKTLSDSQDRPFLIYLTKGKHILRMTASSSEIKPIYEGLLRNLKRVSSLDQQIRKVTGNYDKSFTSGGNVDMNRDWQLEKYIPDIENQLTSISIDLTSLADRLSQHTVGKSDVETSFRATAQDFEKMKSHLRDVPNEMQVFETDQQNLSSWAFRLLDQPLLLDYLWVADPGAKLPKVRPNVWQKIGHTLLNFYRSFTIDFNFTRKDPKAIDVWVNRGRNYVQLIQQLADQTFTPQTGIHVNVNIVPDPNLLIMSNLAGKQPDAALGVDGTTVGDFAMRGALADLTAMPGYQDAAKQFYPGALRVFHYDGKNFALPETQNFKVLIYRTDILDRLGLKPPDTWNDVYTMLPTLQQSGYDFYVPNDYLPFMYQNGAELYSKDGLTSGLDSDAAYKGFQQWTQLFSLFQIPKEVPSFFNHFRLGDIPIGIADFNTYLMTQVAAPEIDGKWKIAPIPGNKDQNGTVERWAGGPLQAGLIYTKSQKQDLAWKFLQWWTSESTQVRFGNDIEAIEGPEYRWNTANKDAFSKLPWPRADLKAIQDQWQWYKEAPQVPGGYFTARELQFAWQNVVTANALPREELDRAAIAINQEMARKQVEFHLRDSLRNVLHPLDIVDVPNPPKGEEQP